MAATFDVSGEQLYMGVVDRSNMKNPMLLIRFAPRLEGHAYCTEWQVEIKGEITRFLEVPDGAVGEPSIEWGGPINTSGLDRGTAALAELLTPNAPIGLMTHNQMAYITPLMKELMEAFVANGREVVGVGQYSGSFGPSHFLLDGVFYKRPKNIIKKS